MQAREVGAEMVPWKKENEGESRNGERCERTPAPYLRGDVENGVQAGVSDLTWGVPREPNFRNKNFCLALSEQKHNSAGPCCAVRGHEKRGTLFSRN